MESAPLTSLASHGRRRIGVRRSLWRLAFFIVSPKAILPQPSDGQSAVVGKSSLDWTAGINAVAHRIYLGTDPDAVADATTDSPEYRGQQNSASYTPPAFLTTWLEDFRLRYYGTTENAGDAADDADVNQDGENNVLEFATFQNSHAGTVARTEVKMVGSDIEFRYTRSRAAVADGVLFSVKWSDTLGPGEWNTAGVVDIVDPIDPGDSETENRIATMPAGTNSTRFIRLEVSKP